MKMLLKYLYSNTVNIRVSAHAQVPAPHRLSKKVRAASHTFVYNLLARVPAPNYFFTTFYSSPGGRDTDVYGNHLNSSSV